MKICVISYDFWDYDKHIVDVLCKKGIDAHHIKMTAYRYPNLLSRAKNAFSKTIFNKNLKKIARQQLIINQLEKLGKQDQILVISPETIDPEFHQKIKKFTRRYIAYLYDALSRNPAEKVLQYFDEVYSFDIEDAKKYSFQHLTNYNYLQKTNHFENKYDLVYVGSKDERIKFLEKIAEKMDEIGKKYRFIIIGNQKFKSNSKPKNGFEFRTKKIPHHELPKYYQEAQAVVDLVREGQSGLSFRPFEAMALEKKLITNNKNIKNYDFYNPNNILILNEDFQFIEKSFFETNYEPIPGAIFEKYTLNHWVETIFKIS